MILAIDIGNSNISCGIFRDSRLESCAIRMQTPIAHFKIASKNLSSDEYLLLFQQFLSLYQIQCVCNSVLHACVISSVVPALTNVMAEVAQKLTGTVPFIIGQGIRTGFDIRIQHPEQLGADIVSNVAGAFLQVDPPFAIVDIGTATTITFVNCDKEVVGTVIIPGLAVSMQALSHSAALLHEIPLDRSPELLGRNTNESICSGVLNGHALMIDGFLRNIREQYISKDSDQKLSLIASGGLANTVIPLCRNKFQYISHLTLLGEVALYYKNHPLRTN